MWWRHKICLYFGALFCFPPHKKQLLKQQGTIEKCVRDPIPSSLTFKEKSLAAHAGLGHLSLVCMRACVMEGFCVVYNLACAKQSDIPPNTTHKLVLNLMSVQKTFQCD